MGVEKRNFRKGQTIFIEGASSNSVFIIQEGTITIRKKKKGGEIEIARIYANEILGEMAFFDRMPRSATAYALSDVTALEIDFDSLERVYKSVPSYFRAFVKCLSDRLRKANDSIRRLDRNYATRLKDEKTDEPPKKDEPISPEDIPEVPAESKDGREGQIMKSGDLLAAVQNSGPEEEEDSEEDLQSQFDAISEGLDDK